MRQPLLFCRAAGISKNIQSGFFRGVFRVSTAHMHRDMLIFCPDGHSSKKQSVKPLKFQRYNLYSFLMLHPPPLPPDRKSPWNNENSRETCSPYTKQRSYMAVWVFLLASRRRAAKRVWIKTALKTSSRAMSFLSAWKTRLKWAKQSINFKW